MCLVHNPSQAYCKDTVPSSTQWSEFCHTAEELNLTEYLPISKKQMQQIQAVTAKDPSLKVFMQVVQDGWPYCKSLEPIKAQPYFKCHDAVESDC